MGDGVCDPGDDRLSRLRHYHWPGGLNGRVRDGNGCGPAGIVAGEAAGGPGGPAGRGRCRVAGAWEVGRGAGTRAVRCDACGRGGVAGPIGARRPRLAAAGRGGQAARLLGPVRCGGRPPCTPGPSTRSSPGSLHSVC